jgi:hypothetical protein
MKPAARAPRAKMPHPSADGFLAVTMRVWFERRRKAPGFRAGIRLRSDFQIAGTFDARTLTAPMKSIRRD